MMETMLCPKCGRDNVTAQGSFFFSHRVNDALTGYATIDMEELYWDDYSWANCNDCHWEGRVGDLIALGEDVDE